MLFCSDVYDSQYKFEMKSTFKLLDHPMEVILEITFYNSQLRNPYFMYLIKTTSENVMTGFI